MDKVQKHNSFNTNTPSSESYRSQDTFYSPTKKHNVLELLVIIPSHTLQPIPGVEKVSINCSGYE
jgi:hypothetical protein